MIALGMRTNDFLISKALPQPQDLNHWKCNTSLMKVGRMFRSCYYSV